MVGYEYFQINYYCLLQVTRYLDTGAIVVTLMMSWFRRHSLILSTLAPTVPSLSAPLSPTMDTSTWILSRENLKWDSEHHTRVNLLSIELNIRVELIKNSTMIH